VSQKFPCPACGFLVFSEPPGSYDLCAICGWEDDHVQLEFPDLRGGANLESLAEYQAALLEKIPPEIQVYAGFQRDLNWRPLRLDEVTSDSAIQSGLDYFHAAGTVNPGYYWEVKP